MKRIFTLFLCSALYCLSSVNAQQIYGDFDAQWVSDTKGNGALPGMYLRPGTQPVGWEASNVNQKVLLEKKETLVTPDEDRMGGDGFSVKMENKEIGAVGIVSGAPGYITLGVPWVFAIADLPACDGGTVGGIAYSQRPDSLVGYYKREFGINGQEDALIMAYMWKGSSLSTVRTNSSGGLVSSETRQVVDQDQCVLGMKEADESNVQLIGKAEYIIKTELEEWTRISIPIEYYSEDIPEKLNVVICASNYWDRPSIKAGSLLWADDVELVCNSELRKLTIGGEELEQFNPKVYEYFLVANDWENQEVVAEGYGANSVVDVQTEGNTVTIVVTDETAKGQKSHTYSLKFVGEETVLEMTELPEACIYGQEADFVVTSNNPNPLYILSSDSSALLYEDSKLKFLKAGTYTLMFTQQGNDDFIPYYSELEVVIQKAPLTVTMKDVTSRYGQSAVYEFEYDGLIEKDELIVEETPELIFSRLPQASGYVNTITKVNASTAMGTYSIRWVTTPQAYNYNVTTSSSERKTLTIGKGLVTVSYNLNRMEGEENPGLELEQLSFTNLVSSDRVLNSETGTYYIKAGVAEGEVTAEFEGEVPTENSPAGKYPVTITSTLESSKYDFEVAADNYLWVQTIPTIEIINFPAQVFYGDSIAIEVVTSNDADPTFEYTALIAEEEAEEKVSFEGSTLIATGVGQAKIEVTVNASGSFLPASTTLEFDVEKRGLIASAGDYTREPGEENPEFVLTYEGFVLGDDESVLTEVPTVSTDATIDSPLGFYEVTVEGGQAENYEVIPVNGELSILATPTLEIVNFPETVVYGDVFDVEYDLGDAEDLKPYFYAIPVDSVKNVDFLAEFTSPELTAGGAGPARIELVIEPTGFYRGVSVVKDFEVTKAQLTVTAQDTSRYVGEGNPEFVLTYEGFKFDDSADKDGVFTTAPTATTEADETSGIGFYAITVVPGDAKNYVINPVNGQLEVRAHVGVGSAEMGTVDIDAGVGTITVKGNENLQSISIYDVIGNLIATKNQSEIVFDGLLSNSIYIVKVGSKAVRVIVK